MKYIYFNGKFKQYKLGQIKEVFALYRAHMSSLSSVLPDAEIVELRIFRATELPEECSSSEELKD